MSVRSIPDGYLYVLPEGGYVLQPASREMIATVYCELIAQERNPGTDSPVFMTSEEDVEFWLGLCETMGLWVRHLSLPVICREKIHDKCT